MSTLGIVVLLQSLSTVEEARDKLSPTGLRAVWEIHRQEMSRGLYESMEDI